ncbi:MAG TPA: hypothetical protein VH858_17885 [Hyphomicrobiales bacterium]|jgi:hypothetical protein
MKDTVLKEEITPEHLKCIPGSCPAVYTLTDGNLLIIGKRPSDTLMRQVEGKVASDEFAVVLNPEYLQRLSATS